MPTQRTTDCTSGPPRNMLSALGADSNDSASGIFDTYLENWGAKLTEAAYPVMLRHGAVDNWLDLKLELWKILTEIVKKGKQTTLGVAPVRS
jgi:hypothetical protein